MCGICGLSTRDPNAPVDERLIRRMAAPLAHRGPDGEGVHVGPGIGLGVRRLAIVDLETGDQPIANEDGSVVIVCNGEIYNHLELRAELERSGHRFRTRSDVETIVHLYEDEGLECVQRLRGMFAFALWDAGRRRLMLARDRLGIKPLVWARTADGGVAFASEFKALLAGGLVEPALDPAAIDDLFTWGWVLTPRSSLAGARRLPPGHLLTYEDGRVETRRWWAHPLLSDAERPRLSEAEWAEGLLARLEDAVRIHLRADVPVGVWLSGGIDSSAVAALAARILGRTVDAFSLEFEDPAYDEVGATRTLDEFPGYDLRGHRARHGNADGERLLPRGVWHAEELARSSGSLRQRIAQLTASRVKVALAGEGSDEMLCGYWWYRRDRRLRWFSRLPGGRRLWARLARRGGSRVRDLRIVEAPAGPDPARFRAAAGSNLDPDGLYSADLARAIAAAPPAPPSVPPGLERRAPVEWLQYWDIATRMHDSIVQTLDRHTMAWSVEIRVPFLDHEVAEWCLAMPPALKQGRPEKRVLRRAMTRDLPTVIRERPKRGLSGPGGAWLRGDPPPYVEELLSPASLRATGWFDPDAVHRLLRIHRSGAADRERELQGVLQVQLWDEIFVRGRRPDDFAA